MNRMLRAAPAGRILPIVPALAVVALLTGCATPTPPDRLRQEVQQLVAARDSAAADPTEGAPAVAPLPVPLQQDDAVRLAWLRSPAMQVLWARLLMDDAEATKAATLPDLHLALARLREGDSRDVERLLRLDLLALLTLPARAEAAREGLQQTRLLAAQTALELAADTRRAWVEAVAAQQAAGYLEEAFDATDAAFELARRMAAVGNWPRMRLLEYQLLRGEAARQLARARLAAQATRERLTRLLGLWGTDVGFTLPDRLPSLPEALPADRADGIGLEAHALRERLDVQAARQALQQAQRRLGADRLAAAVPELALGRIHDTHTDGQGRREQTRGVELELSLPMPGSGRAARQRSDAGLALAQARLNAAAVQARSQVRQAWHAWRTAHDLARQAQAELVPLAEQLTEETLLRYNGMLASPWDLLDRARRQRLAVTDAVAALRDFWLRDIDLNQALTGSAPLDVVPGPAAPGADPGPKGH